MEVRLNRTKIVRIRFRMKLKHKLWRIYYYLFTDSFSRDNITLKELLKDEEEQTEQ